MFHNRNGKNDSVRISAWVSRLIIILQRLHFTRTISLCWERLTSQSHDLRHGVHDGGLGRNRPSLHRVPRCHVNDHQLAPLADTYVLVALERTRAELDGFRRHSGGLHQLEGGCGNKGYGARGRASGVGFADETKYWNYRSLRVTLILCSIETSTS